jgi:hypothetical protein
MAFHQLTGTFKELASRLDVSTLPARLVMNVPPSKKITACAKECDRIVERHTKTRSNMHVLKQCAI